jgi:hypothetical protein
MRKVKGKDYKMPEKSAELKSIEERIQRERDQKERALTEKTVIDSAAAAESAVIGSEEVKFSLREITELVMTYCKEHNGDIIDPVTGAGISQFIAKRSIEIEAQIRRAKAAEFAEEDPKNIPTAQEMMEDQTDDDDDISSSPQP